MGKSKRLATQIAVCSNCSQTLGWPVTGVAKVTYTSSETKHDSAQPDRGIFPRLSGIFSQDVNKERSCGMWHLPHCNTQLVEMYLKQPHPPPGLPANQDEWVRNGSNVASWDDQELCLLALKKKKSYIHLPPGSPRRWRGGQGRAGSFSGRVLVTVTKQSSGDSGRMQELRSQASLNKWDDQGEEGPSWRLTFLSNGWIWGRHTIKHDTLVGVGKGRKGVRILDFAH